MMISILSSSLYLPSTDSRNLCLNLHNYSLRLNTLDSLKVCAIVFMIIDHIGYFLLPNDSIKSLISFNMIILKDPSLVQDDYFRIHLLRSE